MNATLPFVFALYPVLLGSLGVAWLPAAGARRRGDWAIALLSSFSVVVFAFLASPWAFSSFYLRHALPFLFAFAALRSYRRLGIAEVSAAKPRRSSLSVAVFLLFGALDVLLVCSLYRTEETIDLSFPLASGTFCVVQGGSSAITNPFHALSGNRLALDLVQLNRFGNRAAGIAPAGLDAYEIFGRRVLSPCTGEVSALQDGLPDTAPGRPDSEHRRGNHVVLDCGSAEVVLAHLMRRSIEVTVGQTLHAGDPVGRVGNSGNTLEPHLHVAAKRNGRDVRLRFDGRTLAINSVVVVGG